MLNGYWWKSGNSNNTGIRWLAWDRMCSAKSRGGLGFRNLHGFNIALLGKHVWNFVQNPNSLVSRVFKERYFPNCHVLQSQKGDGSSFLWGGIWQAKEILKGGFKWVLGDGRNINIFTDQWLRGKSKFRVEDHHVNRTRSDKVYEYFRPNTKEWDVTKVQQTFHEVDIQHILQTRIPQTSIRDRVAWMDTSTGIYTAKSGYQFWYNSNHDRREAELETGWKKLWKLQVPHKVKYFLWRLCKNNIPTRKLLRSKGVLVTITCPFCITDVEHLRHVFIECPFASSCWRHHGDGIEFGDIEEVPVWLLSQFQVRPASQMVRIASILWGVWLARNKLVWEDKKLEANIAMDLSSRLIKEWQTAQKLHVVTAGVGNQGRATGQMRWLISDEGWHKMNVDASIRMRQTRFQVGMVLRDDSGQFKFGMTKVVSGHASVLEAEAMGVLEALRWIVNKGMTQVVVETDSLMITSALSTGTVYLHEVGDILGMCSSILMERRDLVVKHIRRQANRVAHSIASLTCLSGDAVEYYSPPSGVLERLIYDVDS